MATIGDLVLIYQQESPAFFARIEDISADSKPDWFQVRLLVLQVPVVETVWILREAYIDGETFTMNGRRMKLEKVGAPRQLKRQSLPLERGSRKRAKSTDYKVISLFDRKKL